MKQDRALLPLVVVAVVIAILLRLMPFWRDAMSGLSPGDRAKLPRLVIPLAIAVVFILVECGRALARSRDAGGSGGRLR